MSYLQKAKRYLEQAEPRRGSSVADLWAFWEERSATMEHEGGLLRDEADRSALNCLPPFDWPPLPPRGLFGEALEDAWEEWWRQLEQQQDLP